MKRATLEVGLVMLTCAACAVPVEPPEPTHTESSELIGGRYTFERPEVGSIRVGGGACTATLFGSARTVLTAAHCVDFRTTAGPGSYGDFTLEVRPGEQYRYTIRQMVSFGGYSSPSRDDVALLQLSEAVPSSVAAPDPPISASPARGEEVTIYGFGCQRRGTSGHFAKQAHTFRWAETTRNLCPGDSGGPTITAAGEVIQVNSAYIVGEGTDLFGDVLRHEAALRRYVEAWRGSSPLVWAGDAPSDPPPSDPPPGGSIEARCQAHATCEACSNDQFCGWCDGGCHGLHLGPSGRLAGNTCTAPPIIAPWSCPADGGGSAPPGPAPGADCGGWSGLSELTCHSDGTQFVRCGPAGIEYAYCPSGYRCRPGSTELLCYR